MRLKTAIQNLKKKERDEEIKKSEDESAQMKSFSSKESDQDDECK